LVVQFDTKIHLLVVIIETVTGRDGFACDLLENS